MKQQDTHIHSQDRTLEELCHDINLKAENAYLKLSNRSKYLLSIFAILLLGFLALARYFQWFEINWYRGLMMLAALMVWSVVIYLINQLLINRMKHATTPKQHLRSAKCLKWWVKLNRAFVALIIFIPLLEPLVAGHQYITTLMIAGPILFLCYLGAAINSDFSDCLDELEYRLED